MVLDGAVDANLSLITDAKADAPAIETALHPWTAELHLSAELPAGRGSGRLLQEGAGTAEYCTAAGTGRGRHDAGDGGRSVHRLPALPLCADLHPRVLPRPGRGRGRQRGAAPVGGARAGGRPERGVARRSALDDHLQRCGRTSRRGDDRGSWPERWRRGIRSAGAEAVANYLIACPGWTGSNEPIAHLVATRRADPSGDRQRLRPQHPLRRGPAARRRRPGDGWSPMSATGTPGCSTARPTPAWTNVVTAYIVDRVRAGRGDALRRLAVSRVQMYMPPLTPIS